MPMLGEGADAASPPSLPKCALSKPQGNAIIPSDDMLRAGNGCKLHKNSSRGAWSLLSEIGVDLRLKCSSRVVCYIIGA